MFSWCRFGKQDWEGQPVHKNSTPMLGAHDLIQPFNINY